MGRCTRWKGTAGDHKGPPIRSPPPSPLRTDEFPKNLSMRTGLPQPWQQPTIPWQEYSLDAYGLICAFLNSRQTCLSELHADLTECLFMRPVCQHNSVRVFEQVSGKDGAHALCGLDNSPGNELFHARDRGR